MRLFIFLFLLILIQNNSHSQTNYSKLYNLVNGNEFFSNIKKVNNNFLILGGGIVDPHLDNSKENSFLSIISQDGSIKYIKHYNDIINWGTGNVIASDKDTLYIIGEDRYKIPYNFIVLKSTIQGDSLDWLTYTFDEDYISSEAIQLKDNFIYILGRTLYEDNNEIILLKTDRKGNIIKERRLTEFSNLYQSFNVGYDLSIASNGTLMLVASILTFDGREAMLLNLNTDLEVNWFKKLNIYQNGFNFPDILTTNDGVIITWGFYTYNYYEELGKEVFDKYGDEQLTLFKYTNNGDLIWADTLWSERYYQYGLAPKYNIFKLITTHNGDIVACGIYYDILNHKEYGLLLRMDNSGKILWRKIYHDPKFTNNDSNVFWDVAEDDGGNFVIVGLLRDWDGEWNNLEYSWLVKVDKNGCFEPDCNHDDEIELISLNSEFIVNIDEIEYDSNNRNSNIFIYPNPVNEKLFLQNNAKIKYTNWEIYTSNGQKVLAGYLYHNSLNSIEGLEKINSGFYIIKLSDVQKTNIFISKFIKQ